MILQQFAHSTSEVSTGTHVHTASPVSPVTTYNRQRHRHQTVIRARPCRHSIQQQTSRQPSQYERRHTHMQSKDIHRQQQQQRKPKCTCNQAIDRRIHFASSSSGCGNVPALYGHGETCTTRYTAPHRRTNVKLRCSTDTRQA